MKRTNQFLGLAVVGLSFGACQPETPQELPNILWLTSEDNSPFAGCYGDSLATTPNLDQLASSGFLYTHAYANAPVCAPARNTIITGVYANSGGHQHMRSYYPKSDQVRFFPQFLREKGYYCTNNHKQDYNMAANQIKGVWDESSREAHYKNRQAGQPFFAIFNTGISHESSIHTSIPTEELKHDPQQMQLPPYHPDTPEMRHDWAQYYDKIQAMDAWVGEKLRELEEAGLAENTIVFYYGDHGGVLARSKRFVYESGTHVPFIIRIPQKFKHLFPAAKPGDKVDRLISFVDLAPTILSLADIKVPDYMQGKAFLGKQRTADPEYAYMFRGRMDERYDMSRAVRDERFRYIRNYMPYRIYGQHINYLWKAPSMQSWEQAYLEGRCNPAQSAFWQTKPAEELYDTSVDPWEVNNLAQDQSYQEVLLCMRKASSDWSNRILDTGFIPEGIHYDLGREQAIYDWMRQGNLDLPEIIELADKASLGLEANRDEFVKLLQHESELIRYWATTGLLILGEDAQPARNDLTIALQDSSSCVALVAAEAVYYLGSEQQALTVMLKALEDPNPYIRTQALNILDYTNEFSPEIQQALFAMVKRFEKIQTSDRYDLRVVDWLLDKHGVDKSLLKLNAAI
ncbi:sulfatase-like hydrolase/transferase [Sunxiuqinia elliptica]